MQSRKDLIETLSRPAISSCHDLKIIFLKYSLTIHRCLQCFQCTSYHTFTNLLRIYFALCRISERIWDTNARDDSVCTDRQGDWNNSCHMNNRKTIFFDTFYHRCAATCAGTSCADEDNAVYVILYETFTDLVAEFCCRSGRGSGSGCRTEVIYKFAKLSVFLHLAEYVKRYY